MPMHAELFDNIYWRTWSPLRQWYPNSFCLCPEEEVPFEVISDIFLISMGDYLTWQRSIKQGYAKTVISCCLDKRWDVRSNNSCLRTAKNLRNRGKVGRSRLLVRFSCQATPLASTICLSSNLASSLGGSLLISVRLFIHCCIHWSFLSPVQKHFYRSSIYYSGLHTVTSGMGRANDSKSKKGHESVLPLSRSCLIKWVKQGRGRVHECARHSKLQASCNHPARPKTSWPTRTEMPLVNHVSCYSVMKDSMHLHRQGVLKNGKSEASATSFGRPRTKCSIKFCTLL